MYMRCLLVRYNLPSLRQHFPFSYRHSTRESDLTAHLGDDMSRTLGSGVQRREACADNDAHV